MELEDAIKAAECCGKDRTPGGADCERCPLIENEYCIEDAMEALADAARRNEYMRPKIIEYATCCPSCGMRLNEFWYCGGVSYCENCGQAIDWTRTNE